jgi:myo-inositol-1-phosphate synthase
MAHSVTTLMPEQDPSPVRRPSHFTSRRWSNGGSRRTVNRLCQFNRFTQQLHLRINMAPHAEEPKSYANGDGIVSTQPAQAKTELFEVHSPNVTYTDSEIKSKYTYRTTSVTTGSNGKVVATPKETVYDFKTDRTIPKVGMMLVGWGGNNGTTVTAGILANRRGLVWDTREGPRAANYYGSVVMSSTVKLGTEDKTGKEINIPFHDLLPMVHPNDLAIGGWDISGMDLAAAMDRAQVLEPTLKEQVKKEMALMKPLPSIYYPDFIAANQEERADNLIPGDKASMAHVEQIRKDIR